MDECCIDLPAIEAHWLLLLELNDVAAAGVMPA